LQDESGPTLVSRAETLNGVSSTWTYSFQKAITNFPGYGIVTDPLGNATKSTFTCIVPGFTNWYSGGTAPDDPPAYESLSQYYQGSASTGTLIKTLQTDYTTTSGPVRPTRKTTTWNQQNLVSKVETDYYNNGYWMTPSEVREYDWGTGAPGALIRRT